MEGPPCTLQPDRRGPPALSAQIMPSDDRPEPQTGMRAAPLAIYITFLSSLASLQVSRSQSDTLRCLC